ncbi:NAD(P)-dependent dehydrogenase (short-subunit alcohol dehydrogenase family) [Micromonospora kangleipakensis]|uniref:NAD(P)-dependent dehydrogenase (Short-subunit alcohol dehydrogenase family) n=1 Tax=Micromonospora kangleipakensis TaxID=1077942 RepID=A0A4Q8BAY2_9ACTN|nr:SDR family NAD(P)-dependent oxidoreductase [Micromonospora kangleipakensis]RZU74952.1 NAD(P)-dependent dehydrogenase (short-subunit alcohol dehydrogenase family) [Micromonospora kangleipakensis]
MTDQGHHGGRLAGSTVVVVGASRGIGRSIALSFARCGAKLVLASRSSDELASVVEDVRHLGAEALGVPADVSQESSVAQLRERALEWSDGACDAAVICAGIPGPTLPLWEQDLAQWEHTLRINLTGVFLCCRAFIPAMVAHGSGSVTVIGSATGKAPLHGRTPYAASKAGLIGLVRTLALEVGPSGVRVNLVSPGAVVGERIEGIIAAQATALGQTPEQVREGVLRRTPLRRLVEPDDVADAVLFLSSPASACITGEDLNVSAGYVTHG